jgi:hypothetical protein
MTILIMMWFGRLGTLHVPHDGTTGHVQRAPTMWLTETVDAGGSCTAPTCGHGVPCPYPNPIFFFVPSCLCGKSPA